MPQIQIAVFERTPFYTPELQRHFRGTTVRIRMITTPDDVRTFVAAGDQAVLILAPGGAEQEAIQLLSATQAGARETRTIVIGTERTAELECSLRELGADLFLWDPVPGHVLADACRRVIQAFGTAPACPD